MEQGLLHLREGTLIPEAEGLLSDGMMLELLIHLLKNAGGAFDFKVPLESS